MRRVCDFCGKECVVVVKGFNNCGLGNIPISNPVSKIIFDYGDCERESDLCAECTAKVDRVLYEIHKEREKNDN